MSRVLHLAFLHVIVSVCVFCIYVVFLKLFCSKQSPFTRSRDLMISQSSCFPVPPAPCPLIIQSLLPSQADMPSQLFSPHLQQSFAPWTLQHMQLGGRFCILRGDGGLRAPDAARGWAGLARGCRYKGTAAAQGRPADATDSFCESFMLINFCENLHVN